MNRLIERLPGLVIVAGQLAVVIGSARFENAVVIAVLMLAALSSVLLRSRDALGLAAAVLLASAAAVASVAVAAVGCGAAVAGLVLTSVLERKEAKALGVWVGLRAVCAALTLASVVELPSSGAEDDAGVMLETLPPASASGDDGNTAALTRYESELRLSERADTSDEISIVLNSRITSFSGDLNEAFVDVSRAPRAASPSGSLFDPGNEQDMSTLWWLALLVLIAGALWLGWKRRFSALGVPVSLVTIEDDHWGRLQRIAKRSGIVRRPSESVLEFVERLAAKTGDASVIGIGDLISAELYGEPSQRRADVINRWLNLRDDI